VDSLPITLFIAAFPPASFWRSCASYTFTGAVPMYLSAPRVGKTLMMELGRY